MGYHIKSLPLKKSAPQWKVQLISFKKADTENSRAQKPKREWDIAKMRWPALGFNAFMSLEEAKARAKQYSAQLHLKRQEEIIQKIAREQAKTQIRYDAVLPAEFVVEFEKRFIRKRDSQTEQGQRKHTRAYVRWRAAQRMIAAVGVEPSEWFFHTDQIYDYFHQHKMSLRYLQSILRLANLWGFYICRKLGRPFLQIPPPRGYERQRIIDANFEKEKGVARASKPIAPSDLEKIKGAVNIENFNWLFLSLWFGLRPKEIDLLKSKDTWRVEVLPNGRKVFWVYQTKVIALPPEDRWKPIPIIFDEQHFGLKIIESETFARPLRKTVHRHFGDGVTLYAGRKGFVDLMLSKDQLTENISIWMGHSSLQRTWENYKNRRRFHVAGYE